MIIVVFYEATSVVFHDEPHASGEGIKAVECQEKEEAIAFSVSFVCFESYLLSPLRPFSYGPKVILSVEIIP